MRELEIEEKLQKTLSKLFKKDKSRYIAVMSKVDEILASEDIDHYKNLRALLQDFKRVHIDSNCVLLFKHRKEDDSVILHDLDHHDNIYQ